MSLKHKLSDLVGLCGIRCMLVQREVSKMRGDLLMSLNRRN